MKRAFGRALLFGVALFVCRCAEPASDSLPDPYQPPIEHWGQLPDGRQWGAVAGESFDSKGHIWVIERCGAGSCVGSSVGPIVELDLASGKPLKSFGADLFVVPHAILVDKNDHDNIWAVDQSASDGKGEQVWKFSPEGKVLMTLGRAGEKGETPETFNDPQCGDWTRWHNLYLRRTFGTGPNGCADHEVFKRREVPEDMGKKGK